MTKVYMMNVYEDEIVQGKAKRWEDGPETALANSYRKPPAQNPAPVRAGSV